MNKKEIITFFLPLSIIILLIIAWSYFDYALPVYDMASHLVSSFNCRDLLSHTHLKNLDWWQSLFTINPLYPPFVYFIYAAFKLVFGSGRWVDTLVRLFFSTILYSSVYGLTILLFRRSMMAALAATLIFCYPHIFTLTHYDMLDVPGLAMVALALFCFTWWKEKQFYLSNICLGASFALACLTKHNELVFLLIPVLVAFIDFCFKNDWQKIKNLFFAGLAALFFLLPWLIFACPAMIKIINTLQTTSKDTGVISNSFINNVWYYIANLPFILSPFLLLFFIVAFVFSPKFVHKRLLYLSSSGFGGILLLSLFHWNHHCRYEFPVSIPIAIYSAYLIVRFWEQPKLRSILIIFALVTTFAFVEANFSPYPLSRFSLPKYVAIFLGIPPMRTDVHNAPGGVSIYPTPSSDWGYEWALKKMKPDLNNTKQSLAVMPNSEEVSATTYSYLVKCDNINLIPFTPRNWTMLGDDLGFNQNIASSVAWYILKTGNPNSPGSHFSGVASEEAYNEWCNFVRKSGKFKLIGRKLLPDNTYLELYKNISY